jgi:hypothetical protein
VIVGGSDVPVEHTPEKPSWDCRACGRPWPCDPAREAMLIEFSGMPSVLMFYLSSQATDAHGDLRLPSGELFERFQAWVR